MTSIQTDIRSDRQINTQTLLIAGALCGATGVVLGAWGAHGLSDFVGHDNTSAWDTAVLYQLIHAPVLLCLAILSQHQSSRLLRVSAVLLIVGVVLFSGSLYCLVLGGPSWMGPITPLGGTSLIAGWLCIVVLGWRWSIDR